VQREQQSEVLDFEHWCGFCSDAVAGGGARDHVGAGDQGDGRRPSLALQLHILGTSESMGHHDSEIMDDGGLDRGDA
jgi:hypothetical protein